jgi:hypothetical protein
VRRWAVKFGLCIARRVRSTSLARDGKWHLDEMVVTINGRKHWLWRAVDQHGAVLDVLVQSRRDRHASAREGDAPLQISASPAMLRFGPRPGRQSFHALPLPQRRKAKAGATHPGLRGLGKRDVRSNAGALCKLRKLVILK